MAKHEVVIHENNGATKDVAPYTGSYIVKETVKLDSFIGEIAKQCGLPAIQVEAILTGAFEIIEELEQQSLVRIHTDIGTICGIITGSFPTSDAAFDPDRNALELALRLDEEVKNSLADVVPFIAQDDSLTKLRVDNVMDLKTPRPYNLIHGQHVFRVAGFNMVLADEGAEAYLTNALGTTFPLVVDEVVSKQLFKAHTAALLPAGDYKLVVKSRAGDAEGPLQTSSRKVKVLYVEPEPLVTSSDGFVKVKSIDENPIPTLDHFTIRGENVGYKSRDPDHGLPDHGLMGALATVAGQPLSWHCTAFDNDRASEATFQSDGSAEELEPGEYTAALTLNYAVDDGTGDSHLEPLVIENVRFKVGE